jgi:hypothetical protein
MLSTVWHKKNGQTELQIAADDSSQFKRRTFLKL